MRERTQIYLDPEQSDRLGRLARADGRTKSDLIREAIDMYLSSEDRDERRLERLKAAVHYFAEHPLDIPSSEEYVKRKHEEGRRRDEVLQRHWRR
ncbi:MAG: ribbon-helix-helix protein, CopG family [Candidatus Dormibacteraeota bacterium]|nr:ribbon-helix-helix protein, CopG family [Candidatus Dormibacteraeota bacterium]